MDIIKPEDYYHSFVAIQKQLKLAKIVSEKETKKQQKAEVKRWNEAAKEKAFERMEAEIPKINNLIESFQFPIVLQEYDDLNFVFLQELKKFYVNNGWSCQLVTNVNWGRSTLTINFPGFFRRIWNKIKRIIFRELDMFRLPERNSHYRD